MPIRYLHVCLLAAFASLPAFAQDNTPTVTLDEMVVTATRTPTTTKNTVAQTRVIDKQALAHYQGQSAFDVIKNQAGFSHYSSGGSDKVGNFYVRGFDSKSVLVLIDGVRYGSLTTGQPALGQLPADQIERIEILYGASGASLYGADAIGGVIQIFTKKGASNQLSISAGIGSDSTYHYGASASFANNTTKASLSASHTKSDGINAIASPFVASQRDEDGYKSDNASLALSHTFADSLTVGINALGAKSTSYYDDTYNAGNPYADNKNGAVSVYGKWRYRPNSSLQLQYGESIDNSKNYNNGAQISKFDNSQRQLSLSANHALPIGQVIAGVERLEQEVKSDTLYTKTDRNVNSGFIGYQLNHDKFDGQAFVRHDKNSQYNNQTNYNIGLAYQLVPNLRVGASYATGFRAPTFNELYYPIAWGSGGNPNLRPEESKNSEIFVEFLGSNNNTRLTGYHSDVKDLIAGWTPYNVNKAKIKGASLTSDWILGDYLLGLNYDYQDAKDKTTRTHLPIRPEHKGGIYAGVRFNGIDLKAEYQYIGDYYYSANHANKIDSYGLVNLSGTYRLSPNISIHSRINNLFGKEYVTNATQGMYGTIYNEKGTNFFTSVTFSY